VLEGFVLKIIMQLYTFTIVKLITTHGGPCYICFYFMFLALSNKLMSSKYES